MIQKLILLALILFFSANSRAQGTIDIPDNRLGLSMSGEFVRGKIIEQEYRSDDKLQYKPSSGFGFEIGAFYERKWKKRFVFSIGIGVGYREFSLGQIVGYPYDNSNYDYIVSIFEVDMQLITIVPTIGVKMYFSNKPKIYVAIGLGNDHRLNGWPVREYITSIHYNNNKFVQMGQRQNESFIIGIPEVMRRKNYRRTELLFGIEIQNIDAAIYYRKEVTKSFGMRLRYSFLEK